MITATNRTKETIKAKTRAKGTTIAKNQVKESIK
jgi:hypothetical protein